MKLDKITRSYDDACGTAHALELIGDRWALLIARELMFGPRRFGELRVGLPGISANVLTQRLAELERSGILMRRKLPPPASVQVYELTPWGYEAEEVIKIAGRWAARSPAHDPTRPLSAASLMMSFRTMFDAERATDLASTLNFVIGADRFVVTVADGRLAVERGEGEAEVTLTGSTSAFVAAVYGDVSLRVLEAEGALAIAGERSVVEQFTTLFALPSKAAPV